MTRVNPILARSYTARLCPVESPVQTQAVLQLTFDQCVNQLHWLAPDFSTLDRIAIADKAFQYQDDALKGAPLVVIGPSRFYTLEEMQQLIAFERFLNPQAAQSSEKLLAEEQPEDPLRMQNTPPHQPPSDVRQTDDIKPEVTSAYDKPTIRIAKIADQYWTARIGDVESSVTHKGPLSILIRKLSENMAATESRPTSASGAQPNRGAFYSLGAQYLKKRPV